MNTEPMGILATFLFDAEDTVSNHQGEPLVGGGFRTVSPKRIGPRELQDTTHGNVRMPSFQWTRHRLRRAARRFRHAFGHFVLSACFG